MKRFTADAGPAPRARPAALKSRVLVVQATSVSAFYDSQRLVYSRAPGERAYYQFAAWTERPGRAFSKLLSERLDAPFTSSAVRGDLVLHTRLEGLRAAFPQARKTPRRPSRQQVGRSQKCSTISQPGSRAPRPPIP